MKQNLLTFVGYGPDRNSIEKRDKERMCTSIRFNTSGESEFFCNNYAEPYVYFAPPLKKPIGIWIDQSMICDFCLIIYSLKYEIDFKLRIPEWHLTKGWKKYDLENFHEYPLIKSIKEKVSNKKNNSFLNPELRWWNDPRFIAGVPLIWLKNFKLKTSFLKSSSTQGTFNGPDYIFEDIKSLKSIGFEITSYKWNIFDSFSDVNAVKKFSKKEIFNTFSFDNRIQEFKKIINKKLKSEKNYLETDELYLGIVVNDTLVDYEYYILELILNDWLKKQNAKLNGVFIL